MTTETMTVGDAVAHLLEAADTLDTVARKIGPPDDEVYEKDARAIRVVIAALAASEKPA